MCFPKLFLETLHILLDRPDQVQDRCNWSLKTRDPCGLTVLRSKHMTQKKRDRLTPLFLSIRWSLPLLFLFLLEVFAHRLDRNVSDIDGPVIVARGEVLLKLMDVTTALVSVLYRTH